jgi:hypothetical protein
MNWRNCVCRGICAFVVVVLTACSSGGGGGGHNGGGGGNGGGGNATAPVPSGNGGGGANSGANVYVGTWSGNVTNTSCTDSGGSNFCARLGGETVSFTLRVPGNVPSFVQVGGTGLPFSGTLTPSLAGNGDLILTGNLGNGANPSLTFAVSAWDSAVAASAMTGGWNMTITSSTAPGTTTTSWALSGVTQTSTSATAASEDNDNPVGPSPW